MGKGTDNCRLHDTPRGLLRKKRGWVYAVVETTAPSVSCPTLSQRARKDGATGVCGVVRIWARLRRADCFGKSGDGFMRWLKPPPPSVSCPTLSQRARKDGATGGVNGSLVRAIPGLRIETWGT